MINEKFNAFLSFWNDVLILDIGCVSGFISKTIILFLNISVGLKYLISIVMTCIYALLIIYALRKKGGNVILKDVSFLMQNIWGILGLLTVALSIANMYTPGVNMVLYFSTLAVLLSYITLQIYLYATHKMVLKK